jgi:hypothetical protein
MCLRLTHFPVHFSAPMLWVGKSCALYGNNNVLTSCIFVACAPLRPHTVLLSQMMCAAGTASTGGTGNVSCAACPPGRFSRPGAAECSLCFAGYRCPNPAVTAADMIPYPTGTYSLSDARFCTPCPAGKYGSSGYVNSAGEMVLSTSAACSGNCSAGYACPAGASTSVAVQCAAGIYSMLASSPQYSTIHPAVLCRSRSAWRRTRRRWPPGSHAAWR